MRIFLTKHVDLSRIMIIRRGEGGKDRRPNDSLFVGETAMKLKVGLFILCMSVSLSFAGYSDGWITKSEYEYGVRWASSNPPLIVNGGGADVIEIRTSGRLEVRSTSIPVNGDWYTGGIRDIWLDDYSELLYLGGITDLITLDENAVAILTGGCIGAITSYQAVGWLHGQPIEQHIEMVVRDHFYDSATKMLTGHWLDNTSYSIQLINESGYDNVIDNIIFTPEPATILLITLGGLLIRQR